MLNKSVYVLCTGGTISMQRTPLGYAPSSGHLAASMAKIPELMNPDMPHYTVEEYSSLIDSANMAPNDWMKIGEHILKNYDKYDGFVILHGTDTMAYSASALSFMLENLNKPVILTGSQLPLFETRSDARENLINSIWMASHFPIPEVCIFFNNKLFRGNRTKKVDANNFAAFSSPNFPTLAKVGTDVNLRHSLLRHGSSENLFLQKIKSDPISTLRIFPGMSFDVLRNCLQQPLKAMILETYGLGTAPENPIFIDVIQQAVDAGIIIVNCSQCTAAKLKMGEYMTGSTLIKAGVISGGDMTTEAAITKLLYLFSKDLPIKEIKNRLAEDLRGELSV